MRNPAFDGLKAFAIFLVLWGHCIQQLLAGPKEEDMLFRFIYSFHMPLFAMASGYFSYNSLNLSFPKMILKKSRQLLLPCFTWYCLTYSIPKLLLFPIWADSKDYSLIAFFDVLYQNFWFLKSLFICYLLAYLGKYVSWILALLISFICGTTFSISFLFPAFLIGYVMRKFYLNNYSLAKTRNLIGLSTISFVILLVLGGGCPKT